MKTSTRILTTIGKIILLGGFSFLLFWAGLLSVFLLPFRISVPLLSGLALTLLCLYLAWLIWHKKTRKILLWCSLGCITATVLATGGSGIYMAYLNKIRLVDNSNINTEEYLPFDSNSKIARLDHTASLQFTILDNLPRVDGAAALFPMYSSFVNAVYPSNIPALNTEGTGGCFFYTNTYDSCYNLAQQKRDIIFGVDPEGVYGSDFWDSENSKLPLEYLTKTPMGREGFVFFTNVKNPVDSLTEEEFRGIYSGTITNWSQVGGNLTPIRAYTRNYGSGSYAGLQKFMGDTEIKDFETEYVSDLMSGIIKEVADYENHPGAIGYSYYTYASQLMANNNIKILGCNGIQPSKETIGNKTYPITDDFYMCYDSRNVTSEMQKLMDWILSSEGQELVSKSGYAPVNAAE